MRCTRYRTAVVCFTVMTMMRFFAVMCVAIAGDPESRARSFSLPGQDLCFMENRGQLRRTDGAPASDIGYYVDAGRTRLCFSREGISLIMVRPDLLPSVSEALVDRESRGAPRRRIERMDMLWEGANADLVLEAGGILPSVGHYYGPAYPDGILNVPEYSRLVYRNLYDNIDVLCESGGSRIKFTYLVHPGGDPSQIRVRYRGATAHIADDGSLIVRGQVGGWEESAPLSWQDANGSRTYVRTEFQTLSGTVSYTLGAYDRARTLVIDPWATYYGGNWRWLGQDTLPGFTSADNIAIDRRAGYFVSGTSDCVDFPGSLGAPFSGNPDIFRYVLKLDAAGNRKWCTYYRGVSDDVYHWTVTSFALDADGKGGCAIAGVTKSQAFPVSSQAYQSSLRGGADGYVLSLDSLGHRRWATYCGGGITTAPWADDEFYDLVFLRNGDIAVAGQTWCADYPTTPGALRRTWSPTGDIQNSTGIVTVFDSAGALRWSSYFGGDSTSLLGAVVDSGGHLVLLGTTQSRIFPTTPGAFQRQNGTPAPSDTYYDATVSSLTPGGQLVWSTYLGGTFTESPVSIARGRGGRIVVAGITESGDFPVTPGRFRSMHNGDKDIFVTTFKNDGGLDWSTFELAAAGNMLNPIHTSMTTDRRGNIYLTGATKVSTLAVTPGAFQSVLHGNADAFLAKLDTGGTPKIVTYFGGYSSLPNSFGAEIHPNAIKVDSANNIIFAGWTTETDLPLRHTGYQQTISGIRCAFIAVMDSTLLFPVRLISLSAHAIGTGVALRWRTVDERNNYGFRVQRSRPGSNWEDVGFVHGAGNAPLGAAYEFVDRLDIAATENAILKYRLLQIDYDGTIDESPVVELRYGEAPTSASIMESWPSPATGGETWCRIRIEESGAVRLTLHDLRGREVAKIADATHMETGEHVFSFRTSTLAPGAYFLRLFSGETVETTRIIVKKD